MLVKQGLQDPIRLKKYFRNMERNLWSQVQPKGPRRVAKLRLPHQSSIGCGGGVVAGADKTRENAPRYLLSRPRAVLRQPASTGQSPQSDRVLSLRGVMEIALALLGAVPGIALRRRLRWLPAVPEGDVVVAIAGGAKMAIARTRAIRSQDGGQLGPPALG
jgi:hypothetical protein